MRVFIIGQQNPVLVAGRSFEIQKTVNRFLAFLMRLPLGLDNLILQGFLLFVQFMQVFDRPILELLGNGDPRKTLADLILHFLSGHAFLRT